MPFGVIVRSGEHHLAVAIGDEALDLHVVARSGLLDGTVERDVLLAGSLNPLLQKKKPAWTGLRNRLIELLREGNTELRAAGILSNALIDRSDVRNTLPIVVGDYVDFYASIEHATNLGKILRPNDEPLLPNYRWIPIGYHGRSGTVAVSGAPVRRPNGQRKPPDHDRPSFGPSTMLDFELEMGFVTGDAALDGRSLTADEAMHGIFGMVLLNDWSARDIQAWEYQPLGPFLGKSFLTTISPWVVTLDALAPYRVEGPLQEPPPLPHLAQREPRGLDIALAVSLNKQSISEANFSAMYWSIGQMLAHVASNGSSIRAGDLFGSGTVSGSGPGTYGSLIELTWRGRNPVTLADGSQRAFLADGDEVAMTGRCAREGQPSIGFGEVRGRVVDA